MLSQLSSFWLQSFLISLLFDSIHYSKTKYKIKPKHQVPILVRDLAGFNSPVKLNTTIPIYRLNFLFSGNQSHPLRKSRCLRGDKRDAVSASDVLADSLWVVKVKISLSLSATDDIFGRKSGPDSS
jgi:hypothetical protein